MNWKQETIEKLKRYRIMANAVKSIPLELAGLDREVKALQTLRLSKLTRKEREERLIGLMVKRQELEQCLDRAECALAVTNGALKQLPEQERRLLTMLYVEKKAPQYVCTLLDCDRSSLYRHRDLALTHLTLAMYGVLES